MSHTVKTSAHNFRQDYKVLVGVCAAGHAKAAKRWREAEARLHDAAVEARDNCKYLATLGSSLDPVLTGGHLCSAIALKGSAIALCSAIALKACPCTFTCTYTSKWRFERFLGFRSTRVPLLRQVPSCVCCQYGCAASALTFAPPCILHRHASCDQRCTARADGEPAHDGHDEPLLQHTSPNHGAFAEDHRPGPRWLQHRFLCAAIMGLKFHHYPYFVSL